MHHINSELYLYYIFLIIGIFTSSLLFTIVTTKNNLWKINFKKTFILMTCFFSIVGLVYMTFGSIKPLAKQNFIKKNKQNLQHAQELWQKNPDKIIQILEQKLRDNQQDLTAKRLLVNLYLRVGRIQQAEILLIDLMKKNSSINLKLILAEVKYRQNKKQTASKILQEIIKSPEADAEILWFSGKLAVSIGDKNLAIKAWRLARGKLIAMQINTKLLDQALDKLLKNAQTN